MDLDDWSALDAQAAATLKGLKKLVKAFDSEDGLSEEVYDATCDLLTAQMGPGGAAVFSRLIDATDGQFYFKSSEDCHGTLLKMFGEV